MIRRGAVVPAAETTGYTYSRLQAAETGVLQGADITAALLGALAIPVLPVWQTVETPVGVLAGTGFGPAQLIGLWADLSVALYPQPGGVAAIDLSGEATQIQEQLRSSIALLVTEDGTVGPGAPQALSTFQFGGGWRQGEIDFSNALAEVGATLHQGMLLPAHTAQVNCFVSAVVEIVMAWAPL